MRRQLETHLDWKCPTVAALEKDPKKREFLKLNYGHPTRHLVQNEKEEGFSCKNNAINLYYIAAA